MPLPGVHALIPAAGRGERLAGSVPKQYLRIAGGAVLEHAIQPFIEHPRVAGVAVALAADDEWFQTLKMAGHSAVSTLRGRNPPVVHPARRRG